MKIAMANDHAGTKLKNEIKAYLEIEGHVGVGVSGRRVCGLG